ncbi:hypothetical protein CYLTODRAFT_239568 [Cylindrobasidium torrendii FP15055 ss-10]|uniref:Uncharacterized protein n=1 Tax=Cylindrobasidium torrendii FP15055 ss-10 TaxID=1314674 RepID=A0A0D7BSJ6_9AGAR|nr:hypothetical protein CYLTODRAFT_239568 [Cylindrobasidium torrendii FP15055 ss-10]
MKLSHSFCLLLVGIVVAAPSAKTCSRKDSIIRLFTDPDNLPLAEPFCRHFLGWDTPIVTSVSATGTYTYTPTETVVSTATITVAPGAAWARGLTTAAPEHLPTPASSVPRNVPAPVLSAKVSSACYCIESAAHKTRETTTSTIYSTTVRGTSTCTQTSSGMVRFEFPGQYLML